LPCNAEINTTFLFGNRAFPIHSLDTNFMLQNSSTNQICVGGFQPITTGAAPDYDIILGMTFLRNVYLLINYGNFVDGSMTKAPPYVQLLSVTDPAAAHLDFVNTRLGGATTTGVQTYTPVNSVMPYHNDRQTRAITVGSVIGGCVFLVSMIVTVCIT
jgi:hypothetical protein